MTYEEFIKDFKISLPQSCSLSEELYLLWPLLPAEAGFHHLVVSPIGDKIQLGKPKLLEVRILPDPPSLRKGFTGIADIEMSQVIVDWIKAMASPDSDSGSNLGSLDVVYSSTDPRVLVTFHGVYPINAQARQRFETFFLEDGTTKVTRLLPHLPSYLEVTFLFESFELVYNRVEPFEFLKNVPLDKLPDMLNHTRGGSFD